MTALAKEDNTPRWKQDQIEERLREREDAGAKLGEDSLTEVESGCIDALLQESEARGLRQRRDWAKRQCVREKVERTSRSALDQGASRTSGSGGQAEMAELDLSGRELVFSKSPQLSSQCIGRVEAHWKPLKLQGGMHEGREMDTCGASQFEDGDDKRLQFDAGRCEIAYDTSHSTETSWRLAFEPCRIALEACCRKKDISFAELGTVLSGALAVVETRLERCSQTKRDLFPWPLASDLGLHGRRIPNSDAMIRALNLLYGTKSKTRAREEGIRRSLSERVNQVVLNSDLLEEPLPQLDFHKLFQSKTVDYTGEEVQVARSFQWKMVEAAMPEAVGSLELETFCDGGTLNYVREFESFLLPPQDQQMGRTPSIMVEQSHWAEVCSGLLRRGVCRVMHVSELHRVGDRPLLNGLFAVSKQETAVGADGQRFEVCRLIVNLVPTNGCCRSLVGDTSTLPSVVGMSSIILDDNQLLITSSEDIRCFFYLFRTPASWWKYMGFAREVPPEALPASCTGTGWHLVTQVLPMGLINSVAIAQHVHRRVIGLALRGERALASGHQELRRDRGSSSADHLYRVYLDNYDELRKVDRKLAETLAGTPSAWTLAVRQTYEDLGLPRHPKKAVTQEVKAEVQGAWLDGEALPRAPKWSNM